MDAILRFCCCRGEDESDNPYHVLTEDSITTVRTVPVNQTNGGAVATGAASGNATADGPDVEQAQLNQILEATQMNIIDVQHLDSLSLNTSDYIQRARGYEEALRALDAKIVKGTHASNIDLKPRRLLDDVGNKAADWLGRPPLNSNTVNAIRDSATKIRTAVESVKIDHKVDLVVSMDMDL